MSRTELAPALCVSIHDVAPATWPQCELLLQAIHAVADVPVTLLVVPHYHRLPTGDGSHYHRLLEGRLVRGDELALHGYTHLDEAQRPRGLAERFTRQVYTRSEGEFLAIDQAEARRRLEAGLAWFAERGWPVEGFVAPAWLLGPDAWRALTEFSFRYTTTLRRFYLLPEREAMPTQSLVYTVGSAWRRGMSLGWNTFLCGALRNTPLVRLSLHPADADHPRIVRHFQVLLERLLPSRKAMTKAAFARLWAASLQQEGQANAAGPTAEAIGRSGRH
ncbi:DUF2334 domain-containing protein [Noviherbaspirillum massiliense]|uniref:DUF2334 domain-containing protein n=1 Tax=Noviherbaspirillum massiliense TaxID=1465823 RepID=UPI000377C714|nr:polysaccharide deacetylase family protein [Noviherbaspirillum massiliense]